MNIQHGSDTLAGDPRLSRFRCILDEEKLRSAPPDVRFSILEYARFIAAWRAELADIEASSNNSVYADVDPALARKNELKAMIRDLYAIVRLFE